MSWECMGCGNLNSDAVANCQLCQISKYKSDHTQKRKMCEDCGHKHRVGEFCHAFSEYDGDEDDEEDEEDEEEDGDGGRENDEDENSLGLGGAEVKFKEKKEVKKNLDTPKYCKMIKYVRCNCTTGVPSNSRRFEPIPLINMCGTIKVLDFEGIQEKKRGAADKMFDREKEEHLELIAKDERAKAFSKCLPYIMGFMSMGKSAPLSKVCKYWHQGANLCKEYVDVRDMYPWNVWHANDGQIDSICIFKHLVFTGGDRRVIASDWYNGEVVNQVTRDSGDIPYMFVLDGELFTCSANGSVRVFPILHNISHMKATRTIWEHSKPVTDLLLGIPSVGTCKLHGIEEHICEFYTASGDRSVKIWNTSKFNCLRSIETKALKRFSYTKLAQSYYHLFVGTTGGTISVFSKFNSCEREDVHSCNTPGADKTYCLQLSLLLPPLKTKAGANNAVTCLKCSGYNYSFTHLWAGDDTGQITIWEIPEYGLEFKPVKTWKAHAECVMGMQNTWKNMLSIGDDGNLIVWDLVQLQKVRKINLQEWCNYKGIFKYREIRGDIPRVLTSIAVQEDSENGGMIAVGTQYGDVIVMNIGTEV